MRRADNLNFLEPSGSLQVCDGIALALLDLLDLHWSIFVSVIMFR